MVRERKHVPMLRYFDYHGPYAYSITCSTFRRRPYFKDKTRVNIVIAELKKTAEQNNCGVYIYCFMPDHLHLLLSGTEYSNLPWFMKTFKQRSSFAYRKVFKMFYGNEVIMNMFSGNKTILKMWLCIC